MNILDLLTKKEMNFIQFKEYKNNTYIFLENELCNKIGIITKGSIKISTFTTLGNELIYNTISEGGIFGNNLIFSSKPYYKGNVISLSECEIAFIEKNNLLKILSNNQKFLIDYLRIQSNFGKELNSKIKLLSLNSAKEKLIFFLEENNGIFEYQSISSLASYLNLERETLSRTISSLIKEKIITRNAKTLTLI